MGMWLNRRRRSWTSASGSVARCGTRSRCRL